TERSAVLAELNLARAREEQGLLRIIPVVVNGRDLLFAFRTVIERFQHVELTLDRPEPVFERILEHIIGAAHVEEQLRLAGDDHRKADAAFRQLEQLPSWRGRARMRMAEFWDRAALRHALAGNRDGSLLAWLEAAALDATERRLGEAADLIGEDGATLAMTFR